MDKVIPILKWAGGKRQLLPEILPLIPKNYTRYFEPFLGAGAVLFELGPERAVVNDSNRELINVYEVVKQHPEELIELLRRYDELHSKEFYYEIRGLDRSPESFERLSSTEKAARTIYLNRTCYNGLYRVNKKGWFNTPLGHNSTMRIVNDSAIRSMSHYINNSDIQFQSGDYRIALRDVSSEDFVFLDPPYYPTGRDSFIRYDSSLFGVAEQEQLKLCCDQLNHQGVRFIQTNSNCDEIKELYKEYRIIEVDVRRSINAKVEGRRDKEVIILNY